MKKKILFILLIAVTGMVQAQLPWKIKVGSKTILQTTGEDEKKNVVRLKNIQVGTKSNFYLSYRVTPDEKDWIRTVMIYDTAGVNIADNPVGSKIQKGTPQVNYIIPNKTLKALLARHKKIKIYYTSIPSDPEKAAVVRVRRVHICTVLLQ